MTPTRQPIPQGPTPRPHLVTLSPCHLVVFLFLAVTGCVPKNVNPTKPSREYRGPTESLAQVVDSINANNQQIPTLWARVGYFEADVYDERKNHTFVNGDAGYLFLRKPGEMRLKMTKVGSTVIDVGINDQHFWLASPAANRAWWGNVRNLGKPCVSTIPIRPDLVAEVLGISDLNSDFMQPPMPVMKFINDFDVYQFTWVDRAPSPPARLAAVKEVWYDRASKLPILVNLFDENGRIVLSAKLEKHQRVTAVPTPGRQPPRVATQYRLYFPDSGSRFTFSLNDVALTNNDSPNDVSFMFNPKRPGVDTADQVDADCDKEPATR